MLEEDPSLSPAEATKKAMGQITAPIIAITLVLLSVFVPVAFIPGISGQLFRQFAVAVSVVDGDLGDQRADAVAGAVRVLLLRHHGPKRGPIGYVLARHRLGARRLCRGRARGWSASPIVSLVAAGRRSSSASARRLFKVTPTGFLPEEDQGAFFVEVQLPEGASVNRTARGGRAGRGASIAACRGVAERAARSSASALLDGLSQSNSAFFIVAAQAVRGAHGAERRRRRR